MGSTYFHGPRSVVVAQSVCTEEEVGLVPGSSLITGDEAARTVDVGDEDEGPPGEASDEGTVKGLVGIRPNGLAIQSCQTRSGS